MTVLAEVIGLLRLQVDKQSFASARDQIKGLGSAVQAALGADIIGRITGSVHEFVQAADDLGDQSEQLGLASADLQAYASAAEQVGIKQEQLTASFAKLAAEQDAAARGSDESRKLFARLGVSVANADGTLKSVGEILPQLADGLQNVQNPTQRAALTMQLFGNRAAKLRLLLENGSEGLAELRKQFQDLGGGISEDAIKKADAFEASLARAKVRMRAFGSDLLSQILPGLTKFGDLLGGAQRPLQGVLEGTTVLGGSLATMAALGVAAAASMALAEGRAAKLGKIGPVILGAGLVFDDMRAYVQGADSAIGHLLDTIKGKGTADQLLRDWTAGLAAIMDTVNGQSIGVTSRDVTDRLFTDLKRKQAEKQLEWLKQRGDFKYADREAALEQRVKDLSMLQRQPTVAVERATGRGLTAPLQKIEQGRVASDTVQQFNTIVNVNKTNATYDQIKKAVGEGISEAASQARQNNRKKAPVSP